MPSKVPRVFVPMTAETKASLQALAHARGGSLAAVCRDILEETAPLALQMANALKTAKKAPALAMLDMVTVLEEQLAKADQMMLDLSPKATRSKQAKKKTG